MIALPESRTLHAQVWVAQVGRVPLLLLDSDIEENDDDARQVTDRLYGGGKEHRLEQELLLGIGGVRAIRAYCAATGTPAPEVFHTNEGHAGFLGVERIRELVEGYGLDFDAALQAVRAGTVFTTHTPVPAGIDRFDRSLVAAHLTGMTALPAERVLDLGAEDDPTIFNMAHMGLRLGQRANGVSLLHGAGQPRDVRRAVARLRHRRGTDHLGHQRRARARPGWPARSSTSPSARSAPWRSPRASGWAAIDKVSGRRALAGAQPAPRAAGRGDPPPHARVGARARAGARPSSAGPRPPSTRTC